MIVLIVMGGLLASAGVYFVFFHTSLPLDRRSIPDRRPGPSNHAAENSEILSRRAFLPSSPASSMMHLPSGTVVINDIAGNSIARLPAAVSKNGWIAIPKRLCIGGYRWYFYAAGGDEIEIFGGILGDPDDIGIWQLNNDEPFSAPLLAATDLSQPLAWRSIVSEKKMLLQQIGIQSEQQNFYQIILDPSINAPGVFIQKQKIVGWTFGDLLAGGYLWKGPDASNLVYELSVYDFYRLTFENSREEQFILGYAQIDALPLKQLEIFADGFRRNPVLDVSQTPDRLKAGAVIARMRSLIARMIEDGYPLDILSLCDASVLTASNDATFVTDVLTLGSELDGPGAALDVLETVLKVPEGWAAGEIKHLRQFRKDLYQKWLTALMHQGAYDNALDVYQQAVDAIANDPDIHLLGIKLALIFNDWKTAEEILYSQQFPIALSDQVRNLEGQIRELKFQEDKIVIRFDPGSGRIPLVATLNNQLPQDFLVDTGASLVTIPKTAADRLGIRIDASTPRREIMTAGGMISAPEIRLNALEIGGWTEYNITACVIDMPKQSGFGLLGLSYLSRFRMDLNTKTGVLTLAPR